MFKTFIAVLAFVLFAVSAPLASAQQKIAVCNPNTVFNGLDEKKDVQDKMNSLQQKIQVEATNRENEIKDLKTTIGGLLPNSSVRKDKEALMQQKAIEYDVWARMQTANMANIEKGYIIDIFGKISEAVKSIAKDKGIDLVIAEQTPKLPEDLSKLTADQVGSILAQNSILFKTDKVDITSDVTAKLNADFKKKP